MFKRVKNDLTTTLFYMLDGVPLNAQNRKIDRSVN